MPSDEKDKLPASRKPSDLLPQPTPQELQFLDIVYEGSVDKLLAWLQLNQVCNYHQHGGRETWVFGKKDFRF